MIPTELGQARAVIGQSVRRPLDVGIVVFGFLRTSYLTQSSQVHQNHHKQRYHAFTKYSIHHNRAAGT